MTFENPILAGEKLIRKSAQSANYEPDVSGWKIARDGSAEFNDILVRGSASGDTARYDNIFASNVFVYKGEEFSDILDRRTSHLAAHVELHSTSGWVGSDERWMAYVDVPTSKGYLYYVMVQCSPYAESSGALGNIGLRSRNFTDGVYELIQQTNLHPPTYAVPILAISDYVKADTDGLRRFAITMSGHPEPNRVRLNNYAGPQPALMIDVFNMGPDNMVGATIHPYGNYKDNSGTHTEPPPPDKQWHSFNIACYATRSFNSDGSVRNNDGEPIYQGEYSPPSFHGNQASWIFFDKATLEELQGVPNGDIDYVQVRLNFHHWYRNAGGTAVLGSLFANGPSGNRNNGQDNVNQLQEHTEIEDYEWIDIPVSNAIVDNLQAGTLTGIVLGPGQSPWQEYYGYADGDNMNQEPRIRARFRK